MNTIRKNLENGETLNVKKGFQPERGKILKAFREILKISYNSYNLETCRTTLIKLFLMWMSHFNA